METWTHHGSQITTSTGKPVALAHSPDLAPLIASAPELLAALVTITRQCGDFAEVQPALDYATIGNIARAAIAKATGATSQPSTFNLQPSPA